MNRALWHSRGNMFGRAYHVLRLTFILVSVAVVLARPEELLARDSSLFRARLWTTEQGLPQNRVACLKQTRDGYLWIGTWYGLARFDGLRFTVFNKSNTPEFSGDGGGCINALAEDRDGALWIGTGNGLVCYCNRRFRMWSVADGLPDRVVWRFQVARAGGLWLLAGDDITRMNGGKFSAFNKPKPLETVIGFSENKDGSLEAFTETGSITVSHDVRQARTNIVKRIGSPVWCAMCAEGTNLWLGTVDGLFLRIGDDFLPDQPDNWSHHKVGFIYADQAATLWADVEGIGLQRRVNGNWRTVDLDAVPTGIGITCMEQDAEGGYWIGTDAGLVELRPLSIRCYTRREGLREDNVKAVCESSDGAIWISGSRSIACVRTNRVSDYTDAQGNTQAEILCLWPDSDGGVWLGDGYCSKWPPLLKFEKGKTVQVISYGEPLKAVNALFQDKAGNLWASDGGDELIRFEYRSFTASNVAALCPSLRDVSCICEDQPGSLWLGTRDCGLWHLDEHKATSYNTNNGFAGGAVRAMKADGDGTIWFATENGLGRLRSGRIFAFTSAHGLPENAINSIVEDDFDCLWLSGLRGIHRVDRSQLNAVADGRKSAVQCVTFGSADGMESPETNGGETQPGGWKARDGRLWFATSRGAVVIDPNDVQRALPSLTNPHPVVIEQVRADEQQILGDTSAGENGPTRIAAGHGNVIEFRYTANSFANPQRVQFKYRLAGYDLAWHEPTTERMVHYANLRPGDYRFEVVAGNHHDIWSVAPSSFAFSILPHFWQTWMFYIVCVASVIGLAAEVHTYRLRWQHRLFKVEEQRTLANERARIARDLHDELGTALTGLALELDVIGREPGEPRPIAERLNKTAQRVRSLANRMREVVWAVNPDCDTVSSLASFMEQQVEQFLRISHLNVRLEFPEDIPPLPLAADARHQLALGVREALTNVVRHAKATEAVVSLEIAEHQLVLRVRDNGRGCQPTNANGHGLKNLRARLHGLGGSFECVSTLGDGTTVTFRLPLKIKTEGI